MKAVVAFALSILTVTLILVFIPMENGPGIEGGMSIDFEQRESYFRRMLADPTTGEIPVGMRSRELHYAENLPKYNFNRREGLWKLRGPGNIGGRTRAFAMDINNPNKMIAGAASGGMWMSDNGGHNWRKVNCPLINITCLRQDERPGKNDIWYAGTGEWAGGYTQVAGRFYGDGILKSIDGGENWESISSTSTSLPQKLDKDWNVVFNIVLDKSNLIDDELYAATYHGVYKSLDGGDSWKKVLSGNAFDGFSIYTDVAIADSGVLYATQSSEGANGGIWRSSDGDNWTEITPAGYPGVYGRTVIGICPSDQNRVYFFSARTNAGLKTENFRHRAEWNSLWHYEYLSGNGKGANGKWDDRSLGMPQGESSFAKLNTQGGYCIFVKAKPDNPEVVFLGSTNIWRSENGFKDTAGTAWMGGYGVNTALPDFKLYPNHHPDQHDIIFYKGSSKRAISVHDGGISRTEDVMASNVEWESLNRNYVTTQYYTVAIDDNTPYDNRILGGLQDNGSLFMNGAGYSNWNLSLSYDGAFCDIREGGKEIIATTQSGRMMRLQVDSVGNPVKYARLDPNTVNHDEYLFINPSAIDPNNENILYMPATGKLYRNTDISARPYADYFDSSRWDTPLWNEMSECGVGSDLITSISVSRADSNTIYYGTYLGKLFKVNKAHKGDPVPINMTESMFPRAYLNCIALHPTDSNKMMVVFSSYNVVSLFYTNDGGNSWANVSGNLEENMDGTGDGPSCRWAEVVPLDNGDDIWLVGTSVGLFASDALSLNTNWLQQSPEGIGNNIVTMIKVRTSDNFVVASTYGSGVYSANIAEAWQVTGNHTPEINEETLKIYPNPLSGSEVQIEMSSNLNGSAAIFVSDQLGRQVYSGSKEVVNGKIVLKIDRLSKGIYNLSVVLEGVKWSGKMIKN
jgi:hypothetical protein